ncbi:MAG TPA: glycosyltransferase family 39 protein [Anaerolineales bacterium]
MTNSSPVKTDRTMLFIVIYTTVIAAAVRLAMPLNSPVPLNDGGLFYSMIQDFQKNGFSLPLYTSYNLDHIPLVYPPLSFYFTALLSTLFHLPVLDLLRLLPPILSVLCIPAFYMLARELLESEAAVALAVVIFAFIPRTFDWLIMGAGLTRATGFFFALLAIRQIYLVFTKGSNRNLVLAILFCALTVYSHPEAATHTVIAALFFYVMKDRTLKGLGRGAMIALGVAALTAPWWLAAILRHGPTTLVAPFTSARHDSQGLFFRLISLFQFNFTDEYFMTVLGVLTCLGAAVVLVRRQYFLPAWVAVDYLIEPRGGMLYIMIPAAILAAIALDSMVLPVLRSSSFAGVQNIGTWLSRLLAGRAARWFLGVLILYCFLSAVLVSFQVLNKISVRPPDLEAFQWVRENTQPGDQFALLTGENPLRDASSEWFPALTERKSLATVFGYEWVQDGRFGQRIQEYKDLQACRSGDETCLNAWSEAAGQTIDYVYIRKIVDGRPDVPALAAYLSISDKYQQVYSTNAVVIFRRLESQAP